MQTTLLKLDFKKSKDEDFFWGSISIIQNL